VNLTQKRLWSVYLKLTLIFAALQIITHAQATDVEISVDPASRSATVSGRFSGPSSVRSISFARDVAGYPKLGARIRDLRAIAVNGDSVEVRQLQPSEYLVAGDYVSFSYDVDLTPPKDRVGLAHASWVGENDGISIGWSKISAESTGNLTVEDVSDAVFFIGRDLTNIDIKPKSGELHLLVSGKWHFTPDEATAMAREIFDEYSQMLGSLPKKPYQIAIKRFPPQTPHSQWEAETRGRTVTILSSDMPFRTQSLQRLHEQLRHEIFHLWFPNGIDLIGDYTWFYEGFAMYTSLKLAVKLNRIRFEDFLDTLSRAHTIDTNSRPRRPITEPSIDPTVRYARGMLVAFLTDVDVLRNSGGKSDVTKSLRTLFVDRPRPPHGELASEAVKSVVSPQLIQRYIDGVELVDWTADLAAAGIESTQSGRTTTLSVAPKPSGRQKAILDRLGYNNWRKSGNRK
jgi:hypothetical protein